MKKLIKIIVLSIIMITNIYIPSQAITEGMSQLRLKVVEADEPYEIYMLLPKNYIKYAIEYDGLDIEYEGSNTLKYNTVPSIVVDENKVEEKTYIHNENEEFVQIKLDDLGGEEYIFEIISEYTDMDMMYRVKSESKDDLMVINNFTVKDNTCKMEYNYKEDKIQSINKTEFKLDFKLSWWQIVIIIILVVFLIYIIKRRNY